MNLENQKLIGIDEIHISDSLNAPLYKLVLNRTNNTVAPNSNALIIYVDKTSKSLPSEQRREYEFNMTSPLEVNETFKLEIEVKESRAKLVAKVIRQNDEEIVDKYPICLFEGDNYIYTNYENIDIELIYPKNDDYNKIFMSNILDYVFKDINDSILTLDDIYFKDAFTETKDGLDLEVNHITTKCITSPDSVFDLDEEGNLTVKTITATNQSLGGSSLGPSLEDIVDTIYPIGSIYMSVNNVSPNILFGGEWISWGNGRCVVGVDATQTEFENVEQLGGEKTHQLSIAEMPVHTHNVSGGNHKHTYTGFIQCSVSGSSTYTAIAHKKYTADGTNTPPSMNSSGSHSHTVENTGSGNSHNNLQPYITCFMWKRVA